MDLIDLSDCIVNNEIELKKASLRAFISLNDSYDVKKISERLNISISLINEWIYDFKRNENTTIKEKVILFKKINQNYSQRKIAKYFKISLGSVNKYLKNFDIK